MTTATIERKTGVWAGTERERILTALYAWIRQRPGLEYGNYGSPTSYRAELRGITKDLHDARQLLRAVELSGITGEQLKAAFRAFSGRLTWDGKCLDYCTGQYWPTEYRKAACAVLASALWDHYREDYSKAAKKDESPGDAIRRNFKRQYGKRMQERWFN